MPTAAPPPSFNTLADCFDFLLTAHTDLEDPIIQYGNKNPTSQTTTTMSGWWAALGMQISSLIRNEVLANPGVIAAFQTIKAETEKLNDATQELKDATATIKRINTALGLVSGLSKLFSKPE